jgi:hypothetical protein
LLYRRGQRILADMTKGYTLCCIKVERSQLTVHPDDATCQLCLARLAQVASSS